MGVGYEASSGEGLQVDVDGAKSVTGWLDSFGAQVVDSTKDLINGFSPAPGSGEPSGAMLAEVLASHHGAMDAEARGLHGDIRDTVAKVMGGVNTFVEADGDNARGISSAMDGGCCGGNYNW